jgi:hypothetical protein
MLVFSITSGTARHHTATTTHHKKVFKCWYLNVLSCSKQHKTPTSTLLAAAATDMHKQDLPWCAHVHVDHGSVGSSHLRTSVPQK